MYELFWQKHEDLKNIFPRKPLHAKKKRSPSKTLKNADVIHLRINNSRLKFYETKDEFVTRKV